MTQHAITIRPICFSSRARRRAVREAVRRAGKEAGTFRQAESTEDGQKIAELERRAAAAIEFRARLKRGRAGDGTTPAKWMRRPSSTASTPSPREPRRIGGEPSWPPFPEPIGATHAQPGLRGLVRRAAYARLLTALLAILVLILVLPVTLQVVSPGASAPHYIWTEEMAASPGLTIMIGAIVGQKEGIHFIVDLWPEFKGRMRAFMDIVRGCSCPTARSSCGSASSSSTSPGSASATRRIAAVVDPPACRSRRLWLLGGEKFVDDIVFCSREQADGRQCTDASQARILFGVFCAAGAAWCGGARPLPILVIEDRLPMVLMQETFNSTTLHPARAVLPADREPDECGRHHRSADDAVAHHGRTFPGRARQINVVLSFFFAGISGSSTADAASQSKIFIEAQRKEDMTTASRSRSRRSRRCWRSSSAINPDDRLGRADRVDQALFLAGIIPGILIAVVQMATVHAYAKARGYPTYPDRR